MHPDLIEFREGVGVPEEILVKLNRLNGDVEDEVRQVLEVGFIWTDAVDRELEGLNNDRTTKSWGKVHFISS